MTAIRQHTKNILCHHNRNNTKNNDDYYNCHNYRWTIVIIGVIILMTVSVVLAIVFPYRGDDVDVVDLLRGGVEYDVDYDVMMSSSSNAVGDVHDGIHSIGGGGKKKEDGTNGHSSERANNVVNDDGGSSSSVLLSGGGRGDDNNEEQTSNELLSPLDSSSTISDNMNKQHGGGGLFDYDSTPYDQTMHKQQQQQQQSQTQVASSINTSSSSLASCQTNLQQADIDMDKIIDSSEYISFLRDYVVNNNIVEEEEDNDASSNKNLLGSVNDLEELPIEYQVNFNHLAEKMIQSNGDASSSSSGASGSNSSSSGASSSYGIPIATLEEIQKVCLYLSNMGSSAIDEFDWDQISTTLKQQQQNEGM